MNKIVLDAGHSLNTPGKRTPNGIHEWELNNKVCIYIDQYLKEYKDVEIRRTDDVSGQKDILLENRVKDINAYNPDIAISIHHNALNGQWGNQTGIEVYHHPQGSNEDKKIANIVAPKLSQYMGLSNRGVKNANFYILNVKSSIPIVLCEGGFMDGYIDYKVITSAKGQQAYAKAVTETIVEYLGLEKKESEKPIEQPSDCCEELKIEVEALGEYTLNLEKRIKELEKEIKNLKEFDNKIKKL